MRTMNKFKIITLIILSLWQTNTWAQDVHKLSLKEAINLALQENKNIQNANNDVLIAKKKVWETTAIGLPQVTTESKYSNSIDIPVSLLPAQIFDPTAGPDDYLPLKFGQQHSASFAFTASQLVFSGEYIVGLQASKAYQELSQKAKLKSENDVIELVTKSYYTVLLAYKNQNILETTQKDIQKTFDETSKSYKAGLVEETDVSQIELNLLTVNNSISAIKRQEKIAENILKFQIGINITDSILVTDSLNGLFESASLESVIQQNFDVNKNIDYQLLQTQKEVSKLSLKREKSKFLPSLGAFYAHNVNGQTNNFDDYWNGKQAYYQANILGATLNWDLFTSGSRWVKVQQAQLELAKINNQDYLLQQNLGFQVYQVKTKLLTAYETYLKEEKNSKLAEKIYHRAMTKFANGMISSAELTQLNIQYFNSQSALYTAIGNVLNAKAELDKILGNNL